MGNNALERHEFASETRTPFSLSLSLSLSIEVSPSDLDICAALARFPDIFDLSFLMSSYGRRRNYPFEPIIKATTKKRGWERRKREREREEGHPLARPMRCASHDYLPNLEYNFLVSYKIQSTSTLPSRASSWPTLRRFSSLSGC